MKKLGLGIQALSEFKDNNFIYVDKTEQIHRLIDDGKYYFLPTGVSKFSRVSIFNLCG